MDEMKHVRLDRMRYTKNKLASNLALLAIVFNVLYFVSIYESDVGSWYYSLLIGASIVYNLLFMLMAFLASEGVKNYRIGYAFLLLAIGAGQIVRIFILPLKAYHATVTISKVTHQVMQTQQFATVVLLLSLSAICCMAAGVVGVRRSRMLAAYNASLEEKRV
ncbi:MAG: hypothetical protein IKK34_03970 [Clostridia bacterium]|nr:hypothetical protein [Clostridia bacterium]